MGQENGLYHGCSYGKNRCGIRKFIDFKRGGNVFVWNKILFGEKQKKNISRKEHI